MRVQSMLQSIFFPPGYANTLPEIANRLVWRYSPDWLSFSEIPSDRIIARIRAKRKAKRTSNWTVFIHAVILAEIFIFPGQFQVSVFFPRNFQSLGFSGAEHAFT